MKNENTSNGHSIDSIVVGLVEGRGERFEQTLRLIGRDDLADELAASESDYAAAQASEPATTATTLLDYINEQKPISSRLQSASDRHRVALDNAKAAAKQWLSNNYTGKPGYDGAPC